MRELNIEKTKIYYAISVARENLSKLKIPESVFLGLGEDLDYNLKTSDTQTKLNFIYTSLVDKYSVKNPRKFIWYLKYLENVLFEAGIKEVIFEDLGEDDIAYNERHDWFKKHMFKEKYGGCKFYSIETEDMEDELFEELICHSNRRLLSFLFSNKSILNIQEGSLVERDDLGPEKSHDKVYYDWTWFC